MFEVSARVGARAAAACEDRPGHDRPYAIDAAYTRIDDAETDREAAYA